MTHLESLDLSYLVSLLKNSAGQRKQEILEEYCKKHMVFEEDMLKVLKDKYGYINKPS